MSKIKIKYLIIIWIIIIFILSSIPGNNIPKITQFKIPHLDKIVHFIMYSTLQFLVLVEYYKNYTQKYPLVNVVLISVTLSVFYGVIMEILQSLFFINRTGSFYDILANSTGAIIGSLIAILLSKNKKFIKIIGINN